ncbi:small multidrug resistance protein [Calothrix sp. NIES-4071]|nr:small multidrug resistance protein [Calothrix sp. NIES-4071]BAZ58331.1 small multidrug resistance protein [Calothrix sp. NIES-4105]
MSWLFLLLAIVCEIFGTTSMKLASSVSKPIYLAGTFVGYALAYSFLAFSLKQIEVSVAYAVWSGIGIVGTSLIGFVLFQEILTPAQGLFIGLIFIGSIGLYLVSNHS